MGRVADTDSAASLSVDEAAFRHVGLGVVHHRCETCGAFVGGDNVSPYVVGLFAAAHHTHNPPTP